MPHSIQKIEYPYFEFIENQDLASESIPRGLPIKIVCSKEGSAKFVSELLTERGFKNVSYLSGGMNSWGDMLVPMQINQYQMDTSYINLLDQEKDHAAMEY